MSTTLTPLQRRNNMSRIRGKNTTPELKVRRWLHGKGFRFRVNVRMLPGTPDIVLAKYRTCIFVNGCFWHGHDRCKLYTHPKSNQEFWDDKVRRNKMRDQIVAAKLESARWNVVTIWECELKKESFEQTMAALSSTLLQNREKWLSVVAERKADHELAKCANAARIARKEALLAGLTVPASVRRIAEQEDSDK